MPKKPSEYDLLMRKGYRASVPALTLIWMPTRSDLSPRIVISHKVDKRSTVRNKIRRRLRYALGRLNLPKFIGIGIVVRKSILEMTYKDLFAVLTRLTSRIQ